MADQPDHTTKLYNSPSQPGESPPHVVKHKSTVGGNRGLTQAYEFRDIAANEAIALNQLPCVTLQERLARAKAFQALNIVWSDASDRIRILRGRPLPGSLRPEPKKPKRVSSRATPTEEPSGTPPVDTGHVQ